jgi:hypothetical protein
MGSYRDFKSYVKKVRDKEFATLQYLIPLPTNSLPQNKPKVADYLQMSDEDNPKSINTVPLSPFTPLDHS